MRDEGAGIVLVLVLVLVLEEEVAEWQRGGGNGPRDDE